MILSKSFHRIIAVLFAAILASLAACGHTDTPGKTATSAGDDCNQAPVATVCANLDILSCSPTGDWIVQHTCGTGQKCQQDGDSPASCVWDAGAAVASSTPLPESEGALQICRL